MAEEQIKSWLEERMSSLDAVYHRYGRDGLKDYSLNDVSMLLSFKELEFRDMPKGNQTDQQRMEARKLELEIKDLRGYVNAQLAGLPSPMRHFQRSQQPFRPKPKTFEMEK